ncbi:peptidoglycan-binding domain-containing protein [Micromonospora sp. CA-269861]|uniref:peptidoglycan-binding domain-containing protein n=1 Tax=Micromonospora sp. CA-269861 TaxID=3239968 RepID=UPI003D8E3948
MISPFARRFASMAVTGTILAGAMLMSAGPAAAAYPTCYGKRKVATAPYNELVWIPAVSSTGSTSCNLRLGNYNNTGVSVLQDAINRCNRPQNFTPVVVDGDFGQKTKDLLIVAQALRETEADGIYGPLTRRAFFWPLPSGEGCRAVL